MSTSGFNTLRYDGDVEVISVLINHQAALSMENILFVKYFLIEMGGEGREGCCIRILIKFS